MKFEEALISLRGGAKIHHPFMENDEYLMACRVGLNPELIGEGFQPSENLILDGISIVKMKGKYKHKDMLPQLGFIELMELIEKYPFLKEKIMHPTMNLLLIMSDEWEIFKD